MSQDINTMLISALRYQLDFAKGHCDPPWRRRGALIRCLRSVYYFKELLELIIAGGVSEPLIQRGRTTAESTVGFNLWMDRRLWWGSHNRWVFMKII